MRAPIAAVALLLVLAGCGSGDDAAPAPEPSAPNDAPAGLPQGSAVPELLSGVECRSDDGTWNARGTVENPTKSRASYQVTVQVGPPGTAGPAATKRLDDVEPDSKVSFELTEIPAASADGPCHVQLLALAGED